MMETITRWVIERGPAADRWFFTGRFHEATAYPKWSVDIRRAQYYRSPADAVAVAEEFGLLPVQIAEYRL